MRSNMMLLTTGFAVIALLGAVNVYAGCGSCGSHGKADAKAGKAKAEAKADCATSKAPACAKAKCSPDKCEVAAEKGKHTPSATLSPSGLKALLDAKVDVVVLDARTGKYFDGHTIPGAKNVAPDAGKDVIHEAIPAKDSLVVTYCGNAQCPLSSKLAARLHELGYTNVIEMPAGIAGWRAKEYKVAMTDDHQDH